MKIYNLKYAIEILQSELAETADLEEVAFFEGAFDALAKQEASQNLNKAIFAEYLADFLREDGIERNILYRVKPWLLHDLEEMLERVG